MCLMTCFVDDRFDRVLVSVLRLGGLRSLRVGEVRPGLHENGAQRPFAGVLTG